MGASAFGFTTNATISMTANTLGAKTPGAKTPGAKTPGSWNTKSLTAIGMKTALGMRNVSRPRQRYGWTCRMASAFGFMTNATISMNACGSDERNLNNSH